MSFVGRVLGPVTRPTTKTRAFVGVSCAGGRRTVWRPNYRFPCKAGAGSRTTRATADVPWLGSLPGDRREARTLAAPAAGVDKPTLHECRHGYASLMLAAGVNVKALSTFMGHANIRITLD